MAKFFVVITKQSRSIAHPLGLYDNHDEEGERLYGVSHGTLFLTRKHAKDASKVWPGSRVIQVNVTAVDPQ